ncbi:MAG: nucleotide excision repair endonuclease [Verrucomicrobia bacterium]|nr:nucleotide excision repair endonuclease [Verrucomicrobiota bacterium]
MQLRLFPDPKPLVERLGPDFFRTLPTHPGVYWMKDAGGTILYVGKAKSLRQRLASYRVSNPDRMLRRTRRLLHHTVAIDWKSCESETEALQVEAAMLLELKPRFNRAGVWRGPPRRIVWTLDPDGLRMEIADDVAPGWHASPPFGAAARWIRSRLLRILWMGSRPDSDWAELPAGWFTSQVPVEARIHPWPPPGLDQDQFSTLLEALFSGSDDELLTWVESRQRSSASLFEKNLFRESVDTLREHFGFTPIAAPGSVASDPAPPPG